MKAAEPSDTSDPVEYTGPRVCSIIVFERFGVWFALYGVDCIYIISLTFDDTNPSKIFSEVSG